ncbi:MAG: trypsin-like peptidase domain-containing protein [Patescibacteria group bacterium]
MEDLTKTQLVLLFLLMSIVVSFTTAIVTAALYDQSPQTVTQTIQRVVERTVEAVSNNDDSNSDDKGKTINVITEEQRVVDVVRRVSPAVVSIIATKDLPKVEQCMVSPFGEDDALSQFFPDFRVPALCQKGTQKQQISAGSGFIVRDDGLVVTNRHVVQDRDAEYTALMNDGKKYIAKVLARDPLQDVAILKIDAKGLPTIALGDSASAQLGQKVIAIGNALGEFQNTISVGIVSGLSRTVVASGFELRQLIQTDAAINPGNSGGPLINLSGEVIGVNTAVASGAENIGFALPINIIKKDISDVEKFGRISYPFLGIRYIMLDGDIAKERKLSITEGALCASDDGSPAVTAGSPADKAGIKTGDVITEFGGEKPTVTNPLAELIQKHKVGETISVKFIRDGKEQAIQLALVERKF